MEILSVGAQRWHLAPNGQSLAEHKQYIVVDSDIRPVWLKALSGGEAARWIEEGRAKEAMPCDAFKLVWAHRWGKSGWMVFPRDDRSAA